MRKGAIRSQGRKEGVFIFEIEGAYVLMLRIFIGNMLPFKEQHANRFNKTFMINVYKYAIRGR